METHYFRTLQNIFIAYRQKQQMIFFYYIKKNVFCSKSQNSTYVIHPLFQINTECEV